VLEEVGEAGERLGVVARAVVLPDREHGIGPVVR